MSAAAMAAAMAVVRFIYVCVDGGLVRGYGASVSFTLANLCAAPAMGSLTMTRSHVASMLVTLSGVLAVVNAARSGPNCAS